jgi:hypothetical protein
MKFSFWVWGAIITQLLAVAFHSLSFFVKPEPQNEAENFILDQLSFYQPGSGMGSHPVFANLFTGLNICFMLIFLFGALINGYFLKKDLAEYLWKKLLLIQMVIFGAILAAMMASPFSSPIVCTGLVLIFVTVSYLSEKNK